MPTPGLSLLGFMDQQQAVNYLRGACVPPDPSDAALIAEWNAAQAKLGPSLDGAGNPDVQDLSSACQPHIQQLQQQDWWKAYLVAYPSATFKAVEIDPLLAFQFHIMNDRSDNHCNGLALGPGIADLLPVCLPLAPKPENFRVSIHGLVPPPNGPLPPTGSFVLVADTLNVQMGERGWFQADNKVGFQFVFGLPFVQVTRCNGQCFLTNGFHRAIGIRTRGADRMPCIFRDVTNYDEIGIKSDGSTFVAARFNQPDPPTLRHFTQGRAHEVQIRKMLRILEVSWSEHILPE